MNQPIRPLIDKLMYFADEYKKAEFPSIACADLRFRLREAVLAALAHPPAEEKSPGEVVAWRQWSTKWHDWEYATRRGDLRTDAPAEPLYAHPSQQQSSSRGAND